MPQGSRKESKEAFKARLKKCAKTLPRGRVAHAIDKMKEQVNQIKVLEDALSRYGPSGSTNRDSLASRSKGLGVVDKYLGGSSTTFEEWATICDAACD